MFQRIDGSRIPSELEMQHSFAGVARASDLCDRLPSLDAVAAFDQILAVVAVGGEVSVGVPDQDQIAEALERRATIDDNTVLCCLDRAARFGSDVDAVVALSEAFFAEATDHLPRQRSEKIFAVAARGFNQFLSFGRCPCRGGRLS